MNPSSIPLLGIEHGCIRRGHVPVLERGSCSIPASGVTALVGINGSGKTTLLMRAADALAARGHFRMGLAQQAIGFAPQHPAFPSWLDAARIALLYGHRFAALCDAYPGLHLAEMTGIPAGRYSTGQRQALSVAIALATPGSIALLDEPFAALDFRRRRGLADVLRNLRSCVTPTPGGSARRALILSTQSADEIVECCDWLVVVRRGRYVCSCSVIEAAGGTCGSDLRARVAAAVLHYLDDSPASAK